MKQTKNKLKTLMWKKTAMDSEIVVLQLNAKTEFFFLNHITESYFLFCV